MSLEFHPDAEEELAEAALHYDRELEGLGNRFAAEVRRAADLLGEHPHIGHRLDDQLSRLILRRFPYSLIYAVDQTSIFVLAVAYHRRRPGYWRSRLDC
jgi:plasmid stabilization system protein ParE